MADRADVNRVRDAVDLVELVSEVTKVRRSGRSFMAVCPFHEEKTPSMSIDRGRGLYHCFGCGEGGDVFTFVEKTQGFGFSEALELLARRAGITLVRDPEGAGKRGRRAAAVDAIRRAIEVYHDRLKKAPEAGPARAHLRGLGYDIDLIDQWRLGFAGTDWDTLVKALRSGGIDDRTMVEGGLARRGRHGLHDVFRGRLMFPIHDLKGDPVGFGARRIDGVDPGSVNNPDAKYVNSADSAVYHKAGVLYGLDRARKAIATQGQAVVVEGYTDVIAMHQAGIDTAVATCGTALGDGHFDLLRRFTEKVVLAFDSDEAGNKAALRGDELEVPFRLDLDLRVVMMPEGLDPADLVQEQGGEAMAKLVADARPLLEHRIETEVARHDLASPEGRARAVHAAAAHVRRIGDEVARREYSRHVARLVGVELVTVERAVAGGPRRAESHQSAQMPPVDRAQAELLRVVLSNPPGMEVSAADFTDERLRQAFLAVEERLSATPAGTPVDISGLASPEAEGLLRSLAMDNRPLPDHDEMKYIVRARRLDAEIAAIEQSLTGLESDSNAYNERLRRLIALQQEKRSLTR